MATSTQEDFQKDVEQYQRMQQQLQMVMMQRQQIDLSAAEVERAQDALSKSEKSGKVYRLAGSIMVARSKDDVEKELSDEADSLKMRKDLLANQEENLKSALTELIKRLEAASKLGNVGAQ
jgi:prefoldin beta subunit